MYVDTESQRDPKYNENVFNGLRMEDIKECEGLSGDPPEEHTIPVRSINEGSVLIISYKKEDKTVYTPYYVHKYVEDSGLLICENCQNPGDLFVEGGDEDQHLLSSNKYDTVMSELVEKEELGYTISTYPLSFLNLIDSGTKSISAHKSIVSDNWLLQQLEADSDLVRYYL